MPRILKTKKLKVEVMTELMAQGTHERSEGSDLFPDDFAVHILPSRYAIDYEAALSAVRRESTANITLLFGQSLASIWREVYLNTITREPNLVTGRGLDVT